jgi:hypothetical protein
VVAFLARGVGNGHGRGLSQWGAFGRAVNGGQSWQEILDAYYGGTELGDAPASNIGVRLLRWDSTIQFGVISVTGQAYFEGQPYTSLYARETSTPGQFEVFRAATLACPGAAVDWISLGVFGGPIVFSTSATFDAPAGEVLGACQGDGEVRHYRGELQFWDTGDGNRVVNKLGVEQYLYGVLPGEVFPSWGIAGENNAGLNALKAQAVAARSYALSQNRYPAYGARTCDTSSCQVYNGAATRGSATAAGTMPVEAFQTNLAIDGTEGKVRLKNGAVVSTEFSASNGPRTAGGAFPAVDDPWDDVPGNPLHSWTRLIDADAVAERCDLADANSVATTHDATSSFEGIWANKVVNACAAIDTAWEFRNAFGLPSPGFELVPVTRTVTPNSWFSFIGDSVGESVAGDESGVFRITLDGMFAASTFDARSSRRTEGGVVQPDGVGAAAAVPEGTDLVIVELGYNDDPAAMPARIDAVMSTLGERGVGRVAWVNLSQRRPEFAATNTALQAATSRWPELTVLDWESASDDFGANRWFSDNVHLTATGRAEFAMFLRNHVVELSGGSVFPRPLVPGVPLHVPVLGLAGVPASGVAGVALNVTAVQPTGPGFLRVWPCGSPEPETSSVNFVAAGSVEPNAVLVAVDHTGEVCVSTLEATDVLVDVTGWFSDGFHGADRRLVDTQLEPGQPLRVPVLGEQQTADDMTGTALNVTAAQPSGAGFLRVWPCASPEPDTSSVNFTAAGVVEPNAVVVGVDESGEVCVSTLTSTRVIVDQSGWFEAGVKPAAGRLVDSRALPDGETRTLQPGAPMHVPVLGRFGVPDAGVLGVALNVTAVDPAGPGFLRVWPCGSPEPETSSVNYLRAGAIEPNAVVVGVDSSGEICVSTLTPTEVLVDVSGWFESGLNAAGGRVVDTRSAVGPIPGR